MLHRHPGTAAAPVGGPLDGLLLDIRGWRTEEVDDSVAPLTELSRWPSGSALLTRAPGESRALAPGIACRLYYSGDAPRP